MLKKLLLVLIGLGLMAILSGCYKLNSSLTVDPEDDTVSGSFVIAFPNSYGQAYPEALPIEGLPKGVTTATYEEENYTGITYSLESVPFADLNGLKLDGEAFPVKFTKSAEGTYSVVADFTAWFPSASEIKARGLEPPKRVASPKINFSLVLPYNITKIPSGADVQGPKLTLTTDWLVDHQKFTAQAARTGSKLEAPKFSELPSRPAADTSAYPLQSDPRSKLPNYLFGAMIFFGGLAVAYGHITARSRGPATRTPSPKGNSK